MQLFAFTGNAIFWGGQTYNIIFHVQPIICLYRWFSFFLWSNL